MTEQILGQNPESTKTESGNAPQPIQNEKWWNDVQDFLARRQQEAIENLKKSKLTAYDYYR